LQNLLFGISGLPRGTGQKFNYATGIAYLKRFGLDAMELPFVRSVNVTEKTGMRFYTASRKTISISPPTRPTTST
jgi:deoxyribonuclease IV